MRHERRRCWKQGTMRVYGSDPKDPGRGAVMCSRHGNMLADDAGRSFSLLRPSDPPARCEFEEVR